MTNMPNNIDLFPRLHKMRVPKLQPLTVATGLSFGHSHLHPGLAAASRHSAWKGSILISFIFPPGVQASDFCPRKSTAIVNGWSVFGLAWWPICRREWRKYHEQRRKWNNLQGASKRPRGGLWSGCCGCSWLKKHEPETWNWHSNPRRLCTVAGRVCLTERISTSQWRVQRERTRKRGTEVRWREH